MPEELSIKTPTGKKVCGNYVVNKKLGEGTYGVVYLTEGPRGTRVAAKKMLETGPMWKSDVPQEDFFREIAFVRACRHPNVMTIEDHYFSGVEACSIMPVMTENLSDVFTRNRELGVPGIKDSLGYMKGVFEGVAYLHDNHFLHLDLKPDNILVHRKVPKISDFGMSRRLLPGTDRDFATFTIQTPSFRAPEVWEWEYTNDLTSPYQVSVSTDNWSAIVMCTKIIDDLSFADYAYSPLFKKDARPSLSKVLTDAGLSTWSVVNKQKRFPSYDHVVDDARKIDPGIRKFYDYVYAQLSLPPDLRATARESATKLSNALKSRKKAVKGTKVPVSKPPATPNERVRKARRWINHECKRLRASDPRWFNYIRDQAKVIYIRLVEAGSRKYVKDAVCSLAISIILYSSVKYPTLLANQIKRHNACVDDVIRCVNLLTFDLV